MTTTGRFSRVGEASNAPATAVVVAGMMMVVVPVGNVCDIVVCVDVIPATAACTDLWRYLRTDDLLCIHDCRVVVIQTRWASDPSWGASLDLLLSGLILSLP